MKIISHRHQKKSSSNMANEMLAPSVPSAPPEVVAFAAQQGVAQFLPSVVEFTRRVFRSCPLSISIGQDAEDETHRYVALDVNVTSLDPDQLMAAQLAWSANIFSVCPAPYTVHFVLGWQ
jgi:hypothetical protein